MGKSLASCRLLGRGLLVTTLGAMTFALIPPSAAHAYRSDLGDGNVYHLTYHWSFPATHNAAATSGSNDYLVYTPVGWTATDRLPLYVVLHGCPAVPGAGAEALMESSRVNPIADSQQFLVLYPDNNASCWHASSPGREHTVRGGGGDADIVAGMTRAVMSAYNADSERVYIIGFSAGADQASATGYAYPDLYAATGVDAGAGPSMDTTCIGMSDAMAPFMAESTVEQMGVRARAMPFFAIGGDGDPFGEADYAGYADPTGLHPKSSGCSRIAYLEALAIDGLLVPGHSFQTSYTQSGVITAAEDGTPEQGDTWTRMVALDGNGCEIAENWIVGSGHAWMGGSTDPAYAQYGINDPKGPSTGANSWAFFRQFTLHGGNTACQPTLTPTPVTGHGNPHVYRASASSSLVEVNPPGVAAQADAAPLVIAPASATVDSTARGSVPRSTADARNLTMTTPVAGSGQNPFVEARQSAPPGNTSPVHQELAAVPAAPVFNADLATADAHARWDETACITDGPVSAAKTTLANAQYQPGGGSDDGENWHGSSIGMDDFISPAGTATSTSTIELARHAGDETYSLDATASTQVTGINVSDALYIEVVSPAKAEVLATGVPGTAGVSVGQPVLRIEGMTLVSGRTFTSDLPDGQVVEVTPGRVITRVSSDGRTATASGTLADIRVMGPTGSTSSVDLTVGTISATATVPSGGVSCDDVDRPAAAASTSAPSGTSATQPGLSTRGGGAGDREGPVRLKPVPMSLTADRPAITRTVGIFSLAISAVLSLALLRSRTRQSESR